MRTLQIFTALTLGAALVPAQSQSQPSPAPEFVPTILGVRGANSAGCFAATSVGLTLAAESLRVNLTDMRASVAPADPFDSSAAICIVTLELGAFPAGWHFALRDVTYTGHATLAGGARLQSFAVQAYFQWEHLKIGPQIDLPVVKNVSGSYLMNVPDKAVDFGGGADYDADFSVRIENGDPAWSPCFTGWEYSYDDKMQLQFQFQSYLTKEGSSQTGSAVLGRTDGSGPALTATFGLVWERCDSTQRNAWGQFRMGDYEICQRGIGHDNVAGRPTIQW
ncbi:hypothetical protein GGS23DRAFT_511112 [Durotheca rogersii]|uniref:uncharacterized protein n=1 Tax=Durotheca rogersii TaxID=419775 RepID=UPI0022207B70|nr:uncharacterized protein GGS23DRAFT_511112 [Durotheca rogersii]KAI5863707.1 hypothetical protein GGS23DRAFT_511112 [Durotheca rogersii]